MKILIILTLLSRLIYCQEAQLSPNAPKDKPINVDSLQIIRLECAIKPYIELARKSYVEAKQKFINGLPAGEIFFVTIKLKDSRNRIEQVFVRVNSIFDNIINGVLASEISLLDCYHEGQQLKFNEDEVRDWLISKPDGTEEGNYIGKFLDNYKQ